MSPKIQLSKNTEVFAEAKLTQGVVRHFVKLPCNVVTTLEIRWHNVATTSLFNVATTLSTDVGKTFISNELTASMRPNVRSCDNVVTTILCLLSTLQAFGILQE